MLKQDYLARYATVDETCEWLEGQTGSKWTLARLLESGLKPWFMLARDPRHNDPVHDELFGKGQATYPSQMLSERDIQNLAIDGKEAFVHKISTHDGREVDVGPVGLWRVPLDEIRFRREDVQALEKEACTLKASATDQEGPEGIVATSHSQPPEGIIKKKRRALIREYSKVWPTIESDLNEGSRNDLDKARLKEHGFYNEQMALQWARERGKIKTSSASAEPATWVSTLHRMK